MRKFFALLIAPVLIVVLACEESPTGIEHGSSVLTPSAPPAHAAAATVTVGEDVSVWDSTFDDPDPSDGIIAIGGSGQINGEFTIAERHGIQIALRAQARFLGPIEASGKKLGRYDAETGRTGPSTDNLATWNYDWHVDLRGTDTDLGDYDLTLHVTNISNGLFGFRNPVDLTLGSPVLDDVTLYQQSWNPGFGNDTFDPEKEDTYNLRLTLSPKDGGAPLSVAIQVGVSDPS